MIPAFRATSLAASALLTSTLSAPVLAAPDSPLGFAGAFVQGAAAVVKSKTEIDFTGWFNVKPDDQSTVGEISAGYGWDFNGFSVRASGFYILGNQKAGTTTQNSPFNPNEVNDTVSMTLKNTWGLVVEPGIRLGDSAMLYGRIGYGWTSGEYVFTRPYWADRYSASTGYSGFLWGVGGQYNFGSNFYGFAQFHQTLYGRKDVVVTVVDNGVTYRYTDRFKPESMNVTLGIGYRF